MNKGEFSVDMAFNYGVSENEFNVAKRIVAVLKDEKVKHCQVPRILRAAEKLIKQNTVEVPGEEI